jgi:hypothetical protein
MLAGLIFATEDAHDRPDVLAATLPFGGGTLVEFQARLLIAAGAGHLLVVVERLTPELLGAINRIARRGVPVDTVRSAAEASAKLHPLARMLVVADGLVTTDAVLALMSGDGDDALLVTSDAHALPGLERVGANAIWAGVARISAARLTEVADLPKEYDFASTLLRVTAQAGASHVLLPDDAVAAGHGVEHDSRKLADRNEAVVAAYVSGHAAWIDRYVQAPAARRILPLLIARGVSGLAVGVAAGGILAIGLILSGWRYTGVGIALVILANVTLLTGSILSWMRDDNDHARIQSCGVAAGSAVAMLLLGRGISAASGTETALTLAIALVVAVGLAERAVIGRPRRSWWGSPAAYPVLLLPFVWAGHGVIGLGMAAVYAAFSLGGAIESLRRASLA